MGNQIKMTASDWLVNLRSNYFFGPITKKHELGEYGHLLQINQVYNHIYRNQ